MNQMPVLETARQLIRPFVMEDLEGAHRLLDHELRAVELGVDGFKLTRASVTYAYEGDVEGEGTVEYLMTYRPDGSASYVGHEWVIGRVGDQAGSFVLQHTGDFEGGTATDTRTVIRGSGTVDLAGLRGELRFSAGHAQAYPVTFRYDFDEA